MTDTPTPKPTHSARWGVKKPAEKVAEKAPESQPKVPETFTGSTTAPATPDAAPGDAPVSAGGVVLWGLVASVALAVWWYRKHPGKFAEHKEELKASRKKSDKKGGKEQHGTSKETVGGGGAHSPASPLSQAPAASVAPPTVPPQRVYSAPSSGPVSMDVKVPGGPTVPVQISPSSLAYSMLKEDENKDPQPVENIAVPVENVEPVQEELDLSLPSELETQIMERLDRKAWGIAARERGLSDTVIEEVSLTKEGIVARIKMNGKGGLDELRDREESVRAILQMPDDILTDIDNSGIAGWALLTVRTRLACPEYIEWEEGGPLGTCTATGEPVQFNWRRRLLVAGESGAGKSTTIRPWLAEIIKSKEAALIYIDTKMVEGALWRGHARVALTVEEVYYCMEEAEQELNRRLGIMVARGLDKWVPTEEDPTLVFVVDEGADHVRESRKREKTELGSDLDGRPIEVVLGKAIMSWMEKITTMGRAAEMHMWWLTQYPTKSDGCPPQIAENMTSRISMVLASRSAADVVFGAENVKAGWAPHRLPQIVVGSTQGLGRALIRMDGHKPRPVQVHYMDKSRIKDLPPSLVWSFHGSKMSTPPARVPVVENPKEAVENTNAEVGATVVVTRTEDVYDTENSQQEYVESEGAPWDEIAAHNAEADKKDTVLRVLYEHGGEMQTKDLEDQVHFSRATLKRVLGELEEKGLVANVRHGVWQVVDPGTGE